MREGTASAWKSVRRAKENEKLFYRVYIYIYTVSGVTLDPSTGGGPCNLYFLFIYIYWVSVEIRISAIWCFQNFQNMCCCVQGRFEKNYEHISHFKV